jgi:nucleoside-diphosphate-sugar epimerase
LIARIVTGTAPHLFCFGLGYSAIRIAERLVREGWTVSGTTRSQEKQRALREQGIRVFLFARGRPLADAAEALTGVTDVLNSVPPDAEGDPVLDHHHDDLVAMDGVRWVGYLSTTGVYGDTGGAAVDETAPLHPTTERSRRRVAAERLWLDLCHDHGLPVHVFRLAGIYGPGRSVLDQVRAGAARRIEKPGQVFSRIHVDDIATIVRASMARPEPGAIYNVCDDEPAEPSAVVLYACELLGLDPPSPVSFSEAAKGMSPMALTFWRDNRRIVNRRLKEVLKVALAYPDYRAGLQAILEAEQGNRRGSLGA